MEITSRAEWGARAPDHRTTIDIPTPKLYLHHAAGGVLAGDDTVSDADLRRIRSIQNYHMDVRGWSDIAYSFLLDPDGEVFEGRGAGIAGGHTAGQNTVSHAICVMGNYDKQEPDADLLDGIDTLVRHGHARGWWPATFTGGHRDAPGASTSCPGSRLYQALPEINARLREDDDTMLAPPVTPQSHIEQIRLLQVMLNEAYGLSINVGAGVWDTATAAAVKAKLVPFTKATAPAILAGREVNALMLNGLHKVWVRAVAQAGGDGGLNDAQVREIALDAGRDVFVEKGKNVTIRGVT